MIVALGVFVLLVVGPSLVVFGATASLNDVRRRDRRGCLANPCWSGHVGVACLDSRPPVILPRSLCRIAVTPTALVVVGRGPLALLVRFGLRRDGVERLEIRPGDLFAVMEVRPMDDRRRKQFGTVVLYPDPGILDACVEAGWPVEILGTRPKP